MFTWKRWRYYSDREKHKNKISSREERKKKTIKSFELCLVLNFDENMLLSSRFHRDKPNDERAEQ